MAAVEPGKKLVVVTGFGPFGQHKVNASWQAVRLLAEPEAQHLPDNLQLSIQELPVAYQEVDLMVPTIWKDKPMLVIHVGVSAIAEKITLETTANAENYIRLDCNGKLPDDGKNCCSTKQCSKILCGLDVDKICKEFNSKFDDISACVSTNAGRYLCEYTYYSSLSFDSSRTLFVHVPDIDKPYSLSQISKGLFAIVNLCVSQLENCSITNV